MSLGGEWVMRQGPLWRELVPLSGGIPESFFVYLCPGRTHQNRLSKDQEKDSHRSQICSQVNLGHFFWTRTPHIPGKCSISRHIAGLGISIVKKCPRGYERCSGDYISGDTWNSILVYISWIKLDSNCIFEEGEVHTSGVGVFYRTVFLRGSPRLTLWRWSLVGPIQTPESRGTSATTSWE